MHNHSHRHTHHKLTKNALIIATLLTLAFAGVEAIAGWYAKSLALISDAGHMAADGLALVLAAVAAWIAAKPPSDQHTYGLGRAEILGAWISSLMVLAIAIMIIIEAVNRIHQPATVHGGVVILLGLLGLIVNIGIAWILSLGERTLNNRAAILHVLGDLLGSVAALISGAVIYFTKWTLIDPILSMFISLLIIISSFRLLRESLLVLMEGVPMHLNVSDVGKAMAKVSLVRSVHDLHIWTLSSGVVVLTAHIEIDDFKTWNGILDNLRKMLLEKFHIEHVTLQPEIFTYTLHHMPIRDSS